MKGGGFTDDQFRKIKFIEGSDDEFKQNFAKQVTRQGWISPKQSTLLDKLFWQFMDTQAAKVAAPATKPVPNYDDIADRFEDIRLDQDDVPF